MPARARKAGRDGAVRRLAAGVPGARPAAWRRRLLGRGRPTCQPGQTITCARCTRWGAERALAWPPRRGGSLSAREEAASAGHSSNASVAANNNARTRPSPVLSTTSPAASLTDCGGSGRRKLAPPACPRRRRARSIAFLEEGEGRVQPAPPERRDRLQVGRVQLGERAHSKQAQAARRLVLQ